jgi:hypothetical protein
MASRSGGDAPGIGMADPNTIEYDAFLANDQTLVDPEIVRVERAGRNRLRIINGTSSSHFWIDLGSLLGQVVAVNRVHRQDQYGVSVEEE